MMTNIPVYFHEVSLQKRIVRSNEADVSEKVAIMMESHYNVLKMLNREAEAAKVDERIKTLRARAEDFYKRAGMK
jgi:hypothetical protein